MVLRLHKAAANSKGERRNEGCDIPADNHAPDIVKVEVEVKKYFEVKVAVAT